MSGAGRKHRAKHLTRQYLDAEGWLGPREGESLAVCLESPHGQHMRVLVLCLASQVTSRTTPAPGQEAPNSARGPSSSASEGAQGEHEDAVSGDARLSKQLVMLPGKFRKVIWLSIKDVVVVADSHVQLKPSPEQLANFLKLPENAEYKVLIAKAQQVALESRLQMERAPLHVMCATTTTSALPAEPSQQQQRQQCEGEEGGADNAEGRSADDSDEDSLSRFVNPNRANIRHRQQYFYVADEDGEEEEKDEEAADDDDA